MTSLTRNLAFADKPRDAFVQMQLLFFMPQAYPIPRARNEKLMQKISLAQTLIRVVGRQKTVVQRTALKRWMATEMR